MNAGCHLGRVAKFFRDELAGRVDEGNEFAGRHAEAFLHFIFAVDLLLGEQNRSSESVSRRAAVLVHRAFECPLKEQVQRIRNLYDARSKYAHAGQEVVPELVAESEEICVQVLWTLLSASRNPRLETPKDWLHQIDFFFAALTAGRPVDEDEVAYLGIAAGGSARKPPNRATPDPVAWSRFSPIHPLTGRDPADG